MTMATFRFISDPGHGWLEVLAADMANVGLSHRDFSRYSYTKGHNIYYLEEDCDAPKFIAAYQARYGTPPVFDEVHQEHTFIRNLPRIHS